MRGRTLKERMEEAVAEMIETGIFWSEAVEQFEKLFIAEALSRTRGNVGQAADLLGVHRNTVSKKIRQYKIRRL